MKFLSKSAFYYLLVIFIVIIASSMFYYSKTGDVVEAVLFAVIAMLASMIVILVILKKTEVKISDLENILKEREERLLHFYDATLDGIILHDNGSPVLINHIFPKITGYTEAELMNMDFSEIIINPKGRSQLRIPLKPYTYEALVRKNDGSAFPGEIQERAVEFRGKMILASVIRDLSKRKEVENELKEERLKRLSWVIDGQEIERERLARELHDGLGQMIIAMKLLLESAVDKNNKQNMATFADLSNMFDKTIDEIRRISNDLLPSGLLEFGLPNALRKLCNTISENSGIKIIVDAEHLPENLANKTVMYVYRIAQEALNNSVKHSNASEIVLKLLKDESFIYLSVEDNGKGFVFRKTHKFVGNGIYNIRERTNMLKGFLDINSEPGKGTKVKVQIPLHQNN